MDCFWICLRRNSFDKRISVSAGLTMSHSVILPSIIELVLRRAQESLPLRHHYGKAILVSPITAPGETPTRMIAKAT